MAIPLAVDFLSSQSRCFDFSCARSFLSAGRASCFLAQPGTALLWRISSRRLQSPAALAFRSFCRRPWGSILSTAVCSSPSSLVAIPLSDILCVLLFFWSRAVLLLARRPVLRVQLPLPDLPWPST
jgi:hypothetical protein